MRMAHSDGDDTCGVDCDGCMIEEFEAEIFDRVEDGELAMEIVNGRLVFRPILQAPLGGATEQYGSVTKRSEVAHST